MVAWVISVGASRGIWQKVVPILLLEISIPAIRLPFLEELQSLGIKAVYRIVDIAKADDVRNWVEECQQLLGVPDIIIANAAIVTLANLHELTPQEWEREIAVNLTGPFYQCKFASEKLVASKKPGHIVLIGSWAAHVVHAHIPAYSVSKAGLRMLGKCLALELAPHGILVNEIAPGYVEAGLTAQIWETNPHLRQKSEDKVPVKRLIKAEEVAAQVAHLCKMENRHMTGVPFSWTVDSPYCQFKS